jgi:cell division protein FtsA
MNQERYVAAIEISSSKIMAAVGKMYADGHLTIIATEQEKGVESVRYGILHNLEESSMRINRVLDKLQRNQAVAPLEITGLYVGLAGRSLRSISTDVGIHLPDDTEITQEIVDNLRKKALSTAIDSSLEVIDAIPRAYMVGKRETKSPKGEIGNNISATYDLIVCRKELQRNLQRTLVDKIGVDIAGIVVTPLSTAQVLLTSEEKRLGCMLVDMGAETTTVSIYKDGALRYLATLPLGGRNITRDITTQNVLEERAENIKTNYGNAIAREVGSNLNMNGVRMAEVSNLIVARSEEIVANIVEQLKYAGMKDSDLPAGLVCIGGGSKLNGMLDLLSKQTALTVRRGQLPEYIRMEEAKAPTSETLQVASILYSGASVSDAICLEEPQRENLPVTGEGYEDEPEEERESKKHNKKEGSKLFGKWKNNIAKFFSAPDEDDSDLLE